jgi:hypothetical protein
LRVAGLSVPGAFFFPVIVLRRGWMCNISQ